MLKLNKIFHINLAKKKVQIASSVIVKNLAVSREEFMKQKL